MTRKRTTTTTAPELDAINPPDPDQLPGSTGEGADTAQGAADPIPGDPGDGPDVAPFKLDTAPVPAPAKRGRKPGPPRDVAPSKGPGRPSAKAKRTDSLTSAISMIGLTVAVAPFDGAADDGLFILAGAPALAEAFAAAAETSPSLAKAIDSLSKASAWGTVVAATVAIALPILANHRVIPDAAALMFPPAATVAEVAKQTALAMADDSPPAP